jgi:hypothetical protein
VDPETSFPQSAVTAKQLRPDSQRIILSANKGLTGEAETRNYAAELFAVLSGGKLIFAACFRA